jgi:hAT family C-terminal dimerisation region
MGTTFDLHPALFPSSWLALSRAKFIEMLETQYDDIPASAGTSNTSLAPPEPHLQSRSDDLFRNPKFVGTASANDRLETFTIEDELRKYLKEPRYIPPIGTNSSPLLWWKANARFYPRLARCARDILAIPGEL